MAIERMREAHLHSYDYSLVFSLLLRMADGSEATVPGNPMHIYPEAEFMNVQFQA
jgi:hypothetical protein